MNERGENSNSSAIAQIEPDSNRRQLDGNQLHLQRYIFTQNQRILNVTRNDHGVNKELQEEIGQLEAVLETQNRNQTELAMQYETLYSDRAYETMKREHILTEVGAARSTFDQLMELCERNSRALAESEQARAELEAAGGAARAALRDADLGHEKLERARTERRLQMQRELNDLTKLNDEYSEMAKNQFKYRATEFDECKLKLERATKEFEETQKKRLQLENRKKDIQKDSEEKYHKYVSLTTELEAVEQQFASETKAIMETIQEQETTLLNDAREIDSLKMAIVNEENKSRMVTHENTRLEEKISVLADTKNDMERQIEEIDKLISNFNNQYELLESTSKDMEIKMQEKSEVAENTEKMLSELTREINVLNDTLSAKKLTAVAKEKIHAEEMSALFEDLKETKNLSDEQNKTLIKMEQEQNILLQNIAKLNNDLQTINDLHHTKYSELLEVKKQKEKELASKVDFINILNDKTVAAKKDSTSLEHIIAENLRNIEEIEGELHKVKEAAEAEAGKKENIVKNLDDCMHELQAKMEEVKQVSNSNIILDKELSHKLDQSTKERKALHNEIERLKPEVWTSAQILEKRSQEANKKMTELENLFDSEKKDYETHTSDFVTSIAELEQQLSADRKTISALISDIKSANDSRALIEAKNVTYQEELDSLNNDIKTAAEEKRRATEEKAAGKTDKLKELSLVQRDIAQFTKETTYIMGKLKGLSETSSVRAGSLAVESPGASVSTAKKV